MENLNLHHGEYSNELNDLGSLEPKVLEAMEMCKSDLGNRGADLLNDIEGKIKEFKGVEDVNSKNELLAELNTFLDEVLTEGLNAKKEVESIIDDVTAQFYSEIQA